MTKRLFITLLAIFFLTISWAQEGSYYGSKLNQFRKGKELFEKGKYASARNVFEDYIEHNTHEHKKLLADAHYYQALCAMELFNNDAEYLLTHFMKEFPESPRVRELYFVMGNFQYRKKKCSKAIKWYKKVDTYKLGKDEQNEYNFKFAYCNFKRNKPEIASEYFLKVKDSESKYAIPSRYFYAHIAFEEKKYETALKDFKVLEEDDLFGPIAPYYIVQIYYFQNKHEDLIEYAPLLLDSSSTRRIPEISRLLGEAYYKTERFAQAIPYLEVYKEEGEDYQRADIYQLAYAYYRASDYKSAAKNFEEITKRKDSISQNSNYHLADCYLQLNEKHKALLAFSEASNLNLIPSVQEDAMYNYAKLSYELSYSPFNEAISALTDYLKAYPNSEHHDQAYSYLSKVFLSTKNYQLAIETIEEIGSKSPEISESYQKVCYFRALEFYTDSKYPQAIDLFNKSIENSKYNIKTRALAKYWRAEALYKIGKYEESFNDFNDFVLTSGAFGSEQYKDAHYNMGYALFKLQDYQKAIVWFRKFTEFSESKKLTKLADAYNRIGDCYFISKNYNFAVDYYDKSIEMKRRNVDYAQFQKAFSLGLLKKYEKEIEALNLLTSTYPSSSYVDDAIFEKANAYKFLNSFNAANDNYNTLINEYPNSEYRRKAFLQSGMIDYNSDKDNEALLKFKNLISDYPKSDEARKALLIMRNIYIDINKVDDYIDFANNSLIETEVSAVEADSLTYISAENFYMEGDCNTSLIGFKKYIDKYPNGRYLLNAHYFKSDCEFANKDYENALESYKYIISLNANEYLEDALLKAAFISYRDSNYEQAREMYQKLIKASSNNTSLKTAKIGIMRTNFKLKDYSNSIKSAMAVLIYTEDAKLLEREVHYTIGKSFYETQDFEDAYTEFTLIADQAKSEMGAEANYRMIEIKYNNKEYDKAIELINTFKSSNSPHQDWVARSFMVWSDIFRINEDFFMAKATLESIIKYYPNNDDDIKKIAENKLVEIEEIELDNQELKEASEIEINMFDSGDEKLFEEEIIEEVSDSLLINDSLEIDETKLIEDNNIKTNTLNKSNPSETIDKIETPANTEEGEQQIKENTKPDKVEKQASNNTEKINESVKEEEEVQDEK